MAAAAPQPVLEVRGARQAAAHLLELGERGADIRPIADQVRTVYRRSNARRFGSDGRGSWPPLAASTLAQKRKAGAPEAPLQRTRALVRSLTGDDGAVDERQPTALRFGTTLAYARYHDHGTKRMPKRAPVDLSEAEHAEIAKIVSAHVKGGEL
jgi:hypothetical protein